MLLPLWGMLVAAILIVSRRPDAVLHAQFWAEDGKLFYADVYNRGFFPTLAVPQSGYFQTLPTLVAGVAQLVPLALAPLLTNSVAIAIRVLPVGLLLSRRAETISPDIRVRALLASLYIALPGAPESNGNIDNALWYLATAAVIVLMLRPPVRRPARVLDITLIALCGVTGVFCIALAPLAFLYRRWRGATAVPVLTLVILSVGAALQLIAIFVLEYHLPGGFGAAPRVSAPLHATVGGFFQVLGRRVIAEPLLGNEIALGALGATLLGVVASACALMAFRHASAQLRLMIAFGGALFLMALAHPGGSDWVGLARFFQDARYFLIPQLAAAATLVWAIAQTRHRPWVLPLLGLLLYMSVVSIPGDWRYAPFEQDGFAREAPLFERARPGTRMIFPLEPPGWTFTLVKH